MLYTKWIFGPLTIAETENVEAVKMKFFACELNTFTNLPNALYFERDRFKTS